MAIVSFKCVCILQCHLSSAFVGNLYIHTYIHTILTYIQTSSPHVPEIQSIKTTASFGQTLSGGFSLSFNGAYIHIYIHTTYCTYHRMLNPYIHTYMTITGFSTTILPHDASASLMQSVIQNGLNLANLFQRGVFEICSAIAYIHTYIHTVIDHSYRYKRCLCEVSFVI